MNPVVLLVVAMVGLSGGIVFLATDNSGDVVSRDLPLFDSVSATPVVYSGGGAPLPVPIVEPTASVINVQVCGNVPLYDCQFADLSDSDVVVYWEVDNGVGCCHSFGCDYDSFIAFCGSPFSDFKLYDISLDGVRHKWGAPDWKWNYTCTNDKVWNYFVYDDLPVGEHTVTIEQKDCREVVDVVNVSFYVLELDGLYYLGV